MHIVPAVDIRGGLCVNLVQGDYDQETVFSEDPVAQAVRWHELGGRIVHIVDLDGARAGKPCIAEHLRAMAQAKVPVEVGGGIRCLDDVRAVFDAGAERVILGTAAHQDPEFLRSAAQSFPGQIVVGIDARGGKVALSGWFDTTDTDAVGFARQVEEAGAARIIYTDILSDGMMGGPNLDATQAVAQAVSIPVTASGGVSSLENVRALLSLEGDGVDEIIIGRALYLEEFTLPEAIDLAGAAP
jgi:phosphoribosylformimino-5-aminoimidazole carboxamide ribotide isomerase